MALGIKDKDTRHIHTAELHVGNSVSTDDPKWAAICSLNAAYCYGPPYIQVLRGYNNPKPMPVFMVEAVYEFEGNAQPKTSTPCTLRRQEYWSILSGIRASSMATATRGPSSRTGKAISTRRGRRDGRPHIVLRVPPVVRSVPDRSIRP